MNGASTHSRRTWILVAGAAVVVALSFTPAAGSVGQRWFASLRIDKPQRVSVTLPTTPGATGNRQLQEMVVGMVGDKIDVTLEEKDQAVRDVPAATRLAGIPVHLLRGRQDQPSLSVLGAREISVRASASQIGTIFREAGKPATSVPVVAEGGLVDVKTPRSVRAEYGHCPPPVSTIGGQIQGPPPASPENRDCVVLTEGPAADAQVPPGLDLSQLIGMALELTGMSPDQVRTFQTTLDWKSTLAVSLPRFMRSYDTLRVNQTPAMLLITAGRRGPTYELVWKRGETVFSLAGYGSSSDALPLAGTID
jgi:hypothetical protein